MSQSINQTFTELEKRKVLAVLGSSRELIAMSTVKLYTACKNTQTWLYSDIEGFLCLILDYTLKTRLFVIFDPDSYERLFQFELYKNFHLGYVNLLDDFTTFEFGNGFIGFKFYDVNESNNLNICVKKFNEDLITLLFDGNNKQRKFNLKKEIIKSYCNILQENFTAGKNNFDENYIEDGLEICKPRYFDLMNNIMFDRDKKQFIIGNVPKMFKDMFKTLGVKKSDFKNTQLALNIFKHFIESIDTLDTQKREKYDKNVFNHGMKSNIKNIINLSNVNNDEEDEDDEEDKINKSIIKNRRHRDTVITIMSNSSVDSYEKGEDIKIVGENNIVNDEKENTPIIPINKIPNITNVPTNEIPNIPKVPTIPNIPNIPNIPKVPNMPITNIPKVPNVLNQPNLANLPKVNLPPQINVPKVLNLPNLPNLPKVNLPPKIPVISSSTPSSVINLNKDSLPVNTNNITNISNITSDTNTVKDTKPNPRPSCLFDELASFKFIKKTESNHHHNHNNLADKRPAKISKNESTILQLTLSEAIKQRRIELTKNDKSDSEDEDSDWSD